MKRIVKVTVMFAVMGLMLSSCNCYNKMKKKVAMVETSCTPSVLALQGKEVKATYTVQFPSKYFNKKAVLRITPVLVYEGGELAGDPVYVQGDKVRDNFNVVSTINGGSVSKTVSFPYKDEMSKSTLELRIDSKCSTGSSKVTEFSHFGTVTVAEGVSTIQGLADVAGKPAIAPDNFKRNTTISKNANVMFEVNRANVRSSQLNSDDIKALEKFVSDNSGDARKSVGGIYAKSYASPEGPLALNNKLSQERGSNTKSALNSKYSGSNKLPVGSGFDVEALGEDWEGFKQLVEASDIPDKNLILQVLQMYSNPEKRDEEIRNMSVAFNVLKEKILPELRRSKLQVDVNVQGMTDSEIKAAVAQNINQLGVEEMLFAATLYNDNADKLKIYKAAADKYNDYRGWNNYGAILLEEGRASEAAAALATAAKINNSSNEIINNLGLAAVATGNYADAQRYLSSINTPDAKYNAGVLNLVEGNYNEAAKTLDGYNLAVAEVLNGNYARAKSLLAGVNTAEGDYLKAVVAAREGNTDQIMSNLRSAVSKNPALKARAARDIEFSKWNISPDFRAIIG